VLSYQLCSVAHAVQNICRLLLVLLVLVYVYLEGIERLCQAILLAELQDDLDNTAHSTSALSAEHPVLLWQHDCVHDMVLQVLQVLQVLHAVKTHSVASISSDMLEPGAPRGSRRPCCSHYSGTAAAGEVDG
jgi:hypothetical protein